MDGISANTLQLKRLTHLQKNLILQKMSNISKALEPYSRAFLIAKIWGEVPEIELGKYRKKLFDRFKKHNWTRLEIEKITIFLKSQKVVIAEFLNNR